MECRLCGDYEATCSRCRCCYECCDCDELDDLLITDADIEDEED